MMKKLLIILLLVTATAAHASAHALWIQTSARAKKGQQTYVHIFFGEYAEKQMDSTAKWFSNLKNFQLQLISPDGKTVDLQTTAEATSYKASFTPTQDGTYLLTVVHHVADVYSKAKIEYYAFSQVSVGPPITVATAPPLALLHFKSKKNALKVGQEAEWTLLFKNEAQKDKKIVIVSPAGEKEFTTNAKGSILFKPAQKGGHFIEAFVEEKAVGQMKDKPFEKVWHVATFYQEIV